MERENSMLFLFIMKKNFNILLNYLARKEKTKNDGYKSTFTKEIPGACSALSHCSFLRHPQLMVAQIGS